MLFVIYWKESAYNLTYYSYWGSREAAVVLKTAITHGAFPDSEAALAACGGNLDKLESLDVIKELGRKLHKEDWRDFHASQLAEFDEADVIWHRHSD